MASCVSWRGHSAPLWSNRCLKTSMQPLPQKCHSLQAFSCFTFYTWLIWFVIWFLKQYSLTEKCQIDFWSTCSTPVIKKRFLPGRVLVPSIKGRKKKQQQQLPIDCQSLMHQFSFLYQNHKAMISHKVNKSKHIQQSNNQSIIKSSFKNNNLKSF